jgi:chromosomal replication initiation ATPase DnaA
VRKRGIISKKTAKKRATKKIDLTPERIQELLAEGRKSAEEIHKRFAKHYNVRPEDLEMVLD